MRFTIYVLGGCYFWIAILVQPLVQPQKCGRRSKYHTIPEPFPNRKIEAHPNSWPWHVGIYSSAMGPFPYCGGTLIAPKWVLTAAHCITGALQCNYAPLGQLFSYHDVTGREMAVTVADHNYTQLRRPAYNVQVKNVIIHPYFTDPCTMTGYDIALLQLNRAVKRTLVTEYACLPEHGLNLPAGYFCKLAGWGRIPNLPHEALPDLSETLMEVAIVISSTTQCKTSVQYFDDNAEICTDNVYGGGCNGDSGGGLHCLTPDGSKWVLYGVATLAAPKCMAGFDSFVLTTRKLSWINAVMTAHP